MVVKVTWKLRVERVEERMSETLWRVSMSVQWWTVLGGGCSGGRYRERQPKSNGIGDEATVQPMGIDGTRSDAG